MKGRESEGKEGLKEERGNQTKNTKADRAGRPREEEGIQGWMDKWKEREKTGGEGKEQRKEGWIERKRNNARKTNVGSFYPSFPLPCFAGLLISLLFVFCSYFFHLPVPCQINKPQCKSFTHAVIPALLTSLHCFVHLFYCLLSPSLVR